MKKKTISCCFLAGIGAMGITIFYYEKNIVPDKAEEAALTARRGELFNAFIDAKFRLQHELVADEDVDKAVENMFILWVSGDSNFKKLTKMMCSKVNSGMNLRKLKTSLERNDPLCIVKYGNIQTKEDAHFLSFNTLSSNGNTIRLKLIRKLYPNSFKSSYLEQAIKFRHEVELIFMP